MSEFSWNVSQEGDQRPIASGDIRVVQLPLKVWFEWRDDIVADHDEETGYTEYKSGFVMHILPSQSFVYDNQPTIFIANTVKETTHV